MTLPTSRRVTAVRFCGERDDPLRLHGWLYNAVGECIERPFEPMKASRVCKKMIQSYATHECGGLIFGYMGPAQHQPAFPNWDILVRNDGVRHFEVQEDLACNWFQVQENAVDVTHTFYTHSKYFEYLGMSDESGFDKPFKRFGFQRFNWGIVKSWEYESAGRGWGNLMVFPNMLRIMTEMHWRVPVDDTTTRIVWVSFSPGTDDSNMKTDEPPKIVRQPARKDETAVLGGTPEHRDHFLSAADKARNDCIMPCVSRCKTGRLVLDV